MPQPAKTFGVRSWSYAAIAVLLGVFTLAVRDTQAHKAVTSIYDYNKDVFPLLRDNCGRCHVEGGPAPMSLTTYKDAVMWAESIREELTVERMPPWPVDPLSPAMKGGHPISSHDLNVIVTWASGGTPHGDIEKVLPIVAFNAQWKLGPPDLKVPMDGDHTVAANTIDETCDFSLATGLTEEKWVKAVDLMPGTASIVRDAVISIDNGPVLALWEPGNDAIAAPSGAAFRLPAGAKIHLQIHYKKHYLDEQNAMSDKSTIGMYFTDAPASGHEIQSLAVDPPPATASDGPRSFTYSLTGNARVIALRPMLDQPYDSVEVTAVSPSGSRAALLKLHGARPQWFRRYWLQEPQELASGSKIEVTVTPLAAESDEPRQPTRFPLQVALDYVPQ
jgi:hypothetical protein